MRRYPLPTLTALLLLSAPVSSLYAQAPPAAAPGPVADRSKSLNALFQNYWEEYLKTSPEFASSIGDKRYNDQVSDYSVKAINEWLAAEQNFLLQVRRHRSRRIERSGKDQPRDAHAPPRR